MAEPRHFDLKRDDPEEVSGACARALERGELVVLPTETIYGVAAREDREQGRRQLELLKAGRRAPFSLAVWGLEAVAGRLAPLPASARRVARRWWPGPVTQVLSCNDGGTLALRVPGQPWTRALLQRVGVPLLMPSANPPGQPAPRCVEELHPAVRSRSALIVDGGPAALGEASTLVRPGQAWLRLLREGVVSAADLTRHAGTSILVVCTGNTCRSPMAGALLERALEQTRAVDAGFLPPAVQTAGLAAGAGAAASENARVALDQHGVALGPHVSRAVTAALVTQADLVLCMTASHRAQLDDLLRPEHPPAQLFDPQGQELHDPFGGSLDVYRACVEDLERMARARARALWIDSGGKP